MYANRILFSLTLVPEVCTDMFRFTIESLFITHAETQLNTVGNILNPNQYPDYNPWFIRGSEWCQGLLRRPQPSSTAIKNMVTIEK